MPSRRLDLTPASSSLHPLCLLCDRSSINQLLINSCRFSSPHSTFSSANSASSTFEWSPESKRLSLLLPPGLLHRRASLRLLSLLLAVSCFPHLRFLPARHPPQPLKNPSQSCPSFAPNPPRLSSHSERQPEPLRALGDAAQLTAGTYLPSRRPSRAPGHTGRFANAKHPRTPGPLLFFPSFWNVFPLISI